MVEFISYDGRWPNLCFGTLIIKADGKTYRLEGVMVSGGCIMGGPSTDWEMWAEHGDWKIDLEDYPELKKYEEEITKVVNDKCTTRLLWRLHLKIR